MTVFHQVKNCHPFFAICERYMCHIAGSDVQGLLTQTLVALRATHPRFARTFDCFRNRALSVPSMLCMLAGLLTKSWFCCAERILTSLGRSIAFAIERYPNSTSTLWDAPSPTNGITHPSTALPSMVRLLTPLHTWLGFFISISYVSPRN